MKTLKGHPEWKACLDEARRLSHRIPEEIWAEVGEEEDRVGTAGLTAEYLRRKARRVIDDKLRRDEPVGEGGDNKP